MKKQLTEEISLKHTHYNLTVGNLQDDYPVLSSGRANRWFWDLEPHHIIKFVLPNEIGNKGVEVLGSIKRWYYF